MAAGRSREGESHDAGSLDADMALGGLRVVGSRARPFSRGLGPPALESAAIIEHRTDFAAGRIAGLYRLADLNRDGALDLVVVNQTAKSGSVLLGNGDGTFAPKTDFVTGRGPVAIALADLNGDGLLDLAVAKPSKTPRSPSSLETATGPSAQRPTSRLGRRRMPSPWPTLTATPA